MKHMTNQAIVDALYSGDNHLAWQGAWEIIRCKQKRIRDEFVPHLAKIKNAVSKLPEPESPSLRDSRDTAKLAVSIIEAVAGGQCYCSVYPSSDQLLVKSQKNMAWL